MTIVAISSRRNKPRARRLLHLPLADWPQVDRDLIERAFSIPNDLFSDLSNGHHLRAATKTSITYGYRRWLGWLYHQHPEQLDAMPADRVKPLLIHLYVHHLRETNSPRSVATQVRFFYDAVRYMSPERDWSWLRTLKSRLERAVPKRGRRPMLINSQRLVDAGFAMMDTASNRLINAGPTLSAKGRQAIALQYRNGLLISLAAFLAYRRINLAGLFIGTTLLRVEDTWIVDIPPERVKNSEPLLADLPNWLANRVDDFVSIYRPLITRSGSHSGLWASAKGTASTPGALYVSFRTAVRETVNLPLTLHDVRSIGYTTWALRDPANAAGAKDLLADRSDRISQTYYNLASGIEASRVMADIRRRQSVTVG